MRALSRGGSTSRYFVRKARWREAVPLAVCLTHDVDNIERSMEHIMKVQDRFSKADLEKAGKGPKKE